MANKGQSFKSHSPQIKESILKEYFDGYGSQFVLAKKYNISRSTLKNWIIKSRRNIDVSIDGRGCSRKPKPKIITLEDYKERYEILKKYQAFLLARREKK